MTQEQILFSMPAVIVAFAIFEVAAYLLTEHPVPATLSQKG